MDLYAEILAALDAEEVVMLATVISTSGSTPAPALSRMLVTRGGISTTGTVGGGCMEGDVIRHAHRLYSSGKAEILTFRLNEDDAEHGLICGGTLDVLIEPLTRESIPMVHALRKVHEEGGDTVLATWIDRGGTVRNKQIVHPDAGEPFTSAPFEEYEGSDLAGMAQRAFRRQETIRLSLAGRDLILEPVTGRPRLVVFGGGHVSRALSRAATAAGFRVTIVDDREKFANRERFPEAAETIAAGFEEAFSMLSFDPSTFIVIVTRGHRHDEEVLERAVAVPSKYVGMIGSRRKVLTAYEHLAERGVPVDALRRVHAPMGLDLGAITAEEIAVSVVAELIAVRRGGTVPADHLSAPMSGLFERLAARK